MNVGDKIKSYFAFLPELETPEKPYINVEVIGCNHIKLISSCIKVYGDEKLVFRRHATAGENICHTFFMLHIVSNISFMFLNILIPTDLESGIDVSLLPKNFNARIFKATATDFNKLRSLPRTMIAEPGC